VRALVAAFLFAAPIAASAHDAFAAVPPDARPIPQKELAEFLGPLSSKALAWKKYVGVDFNVYYGRAQPPLSGDVSFYLGGWPNFKPQPQSTLVKGKLGIFPVQWRRVTAKDGSVTQNALIPLDDYWKIDISIHAKSQKDVDQLLGTISQLPTFTKKPKPVGHTMRPNQSVELTATRCAFTFPRIRTFSFRAILALGGGSSLLSR
jgi:hypothetical protein